MKSSHLRAVAIALAVLLVAPVGAAAKPGPDPLLGNGLGRLVDAPRSAARIAPGFRIDQARLAIRDAQGRVLIDLTPQAGTDAATYRAAAEALGLVVQAVDPEHGTLEGFAPLGAMHALAALPATGTLVQAVRPKAHIGAATSQGVAFQRIDHVQAAGRDGKGITIGAISDSYDAANLDLSGNPLADHAAQDVASGDLPGTGNPRNGQPVVVLQDPPADDVNTDEGRGMLQVIHDVAPAAKLCFATGFAGLVGFADNVRRLADKQGSCGADVVTDDLTYFDEPFFGDSVLSDAIDDVTAKGASYFAAAANYGQSQAWQSPVRLVPTKQGLAGTNLDFSQVDPALYDGGLQDMDPGPATDVAQSLIAGDRGGLLDLQWDDPFDIDGATFAATPLFTGTGEISDAAPSKTFAFTPKAADVGKTVQFKVDAIPSGTTDLILSVDGPDGTNIGTIDTGASPEVLATKLVGGGPYKVTITAYGGDQGDFTLEAREVLSPSKVTTDFNILLFDEGGAYIGAISDLNTLTGRPSELASFNGAQGMQVVIARAGTGPVGATRLRAVMVDDVYYTEHSDPLTPAMFGHTVAKGTTAVAAYDPFGPFLPEAYTSPGGDLPVLFDSAGNRFAQPQVRRAPQIAATDGGNTTFFGYDTSQDADTQPNFFGTSAAAPHAAAIAALALQAAGGPGSIKPAALQDRMERTTYTHDLDPGHASGAAGGLTISADSAQGDEYSDLAFPLNSSRAFTVMYDGAVPLSSITFYGEGASPTALGRRKAGVSDGIVFDPRPFSPIAPFATSGFPFRMNATFGGLQTANVSASYSTPGGGFSAPGQYRHMKLSFAGGLAKGRGLRFGVDRDLATTTQNISYAGNGADELGGATFIPSRSSVAAGMTFYAVRTDGTTLSGAITNRLGSGWTALDGYGVVDAQKLVLGN